MSEYAGVTAWQGGGAVAAGPLPRLRGVGVPLVLLAVLLAGSSACAARRVPPPAEENGPWEGTASWYGVQFHGRRAADGSRFNMYELTAAHPSLPFGTRLKVTNLGNGRAVEVEVTDRGPFIEGRIIDLSFAAAQSLGMLAAGTTRVRLEVVGG